MKKKALSFMLGLVTVIAVLQSVTSISMAEGSYTGSKVISFQFSSKEELADWIVNQDFSSLSDGKLVVKELNKTTILVELKFSGSDKRVGGDGSGTPLP